MDEDAVTAETVLAHEAWKPIGRRIAKALSDRDEATVVRVQRRIAQEVAGGASDLLRPDGPATDWARRLADDPSAEAPKRAGGGKRGRA